ncbi:MAG: type transport system ATP-binding protein [Solirubrobacterales bacterium]|nr:type transport system ATP-binding protein [Solirubrobacterales bacterium]
MSETVISVSGLHKSYGDFEAVRGLDLEVEAGEIFAFLGPNGAGKTTTTEILEGYRERSAGEVSVLGEDPAKANREWHERIGIVLQQCRMRPELTVRETLELYAGYYREPSGVDETIEHVGLGAKAEARAGALSGGQLRRLDVGVALIGDPDLLFLDEPTTGFDPTARRQFWSLIAGLRELGKTVFLTTHYMDEAQVLADRVAIVVGGKIIAEGPPDELGSTAATTEIRFRPPDGVAVTDLPLASAARTEDGRLVIARTNDPVRALNELTSWALQGGYELPGLEVGTPSLEDIYIELTSGASE